MILVSINDERLTCFCLCIYIPRFKICKWKEKREVKKKKGNVSNIPPKNYKILLGKAGFVFPSNLIKLNFHSARYFNLT